MVYQSSSRPLLTLGRSMMSRPFLPRNCIQNLPVELVCMILQNLDMPDLLRCTLVSKSIRKAVNESSRLKYIIELAKHRMIHVLPSTTNLSFASRLKFLRNREHAWKYLDFKQRRPLNLPPTGSVYEFVGGLYGNGREDETRATASISFLELPSSDASLLGDTQDVLRIWTHPMDDVTIIDFTMDPAQDLLVLVGLAPADSNSIYELHLRSIKTNQPHPKAPMTTYHCLSSPSVQPLPSDIVAAVRVQVFGQLVALLIKEVFESTGAHLEIWNWASGSLYSSSMFEIDGIDDFTFLSQNSFLTVLPAGRFEIYDFADPMSESTIPVHRVGYSFPPLSDGHLYWYISMSSNPAPGYIPSCPSSEDAIPGSGRQVYYPCPEERIHACCLYILNTANEENAIVHSFVFFVNLKTLTNPPSEWLKQHRVRRKRTRHCNANQNFISSSTNTSATVQDTNHANSNVHSNNSSGHSYPPFPTFGSAPHPQHLQTSDDPSTSSAPANVSPPSASEAASRLRNRCDIDVTVPWHIWGPQSTRWFEECLSTDWQHAVYSTRAVDTVRPENHPRYSKSPFVADVQAGPSNAAANLDQDLASQHQAQSSQTDADDDDADEEEARSSSRLRHLRLRNFNPCVFKDRDLQDEVLPSNPEPDKKTANEHVFDFDLLGIEHRGGLRSVVGRDSSKPGELQWNKPRLVNWPSTTPVKGVFTQDIVSWLPYTEVISRSTHEVTDVMMDDSRLLLLKRGRGGRLKHVEVLMT